MKSSMISAQDAFEKMERRVHGPQDPVKDQLDSCELAICQKLTRQCLSAFELATLKNRESFICSIFFSTSIQQGTIDALKQTDWLVGKNGHRGLSIELPRTVSTENGNCADKYIMTAQEATNRMYQLFYGPNSLPRDQLEFCYLCFLKKLVNRPSLSEPIKLRLIEDAQDETESTLKELGWQISFPEYPRKHILNLYIPQALIRASRKNTQQ